MDFPPEKRMCMRASTQSSTRSCCDMPDWKGREQEVLRPRTCTPGTADKAVQTEEAVERPEEKRRQSPSPSPSPGNRRLRRRSICLLVPCETHPLVQFPELIPGYPSTEAILEKEREAAWQRFHQLLRPKSDAVPSTSGEGMSLGTVIARGSSRTNCTQAAFAATTSVISGLAAFTTTGLTHTSQPRSRSVPVLGGSSTPASSTRARSRIEGTRKRIKEEDRSDAKWPFGPPAGKRRRL
ncbi:uncharacterized protein LOC115601966 isoform X2 [Strigops habroptila]|uniref:uncharacterized protein LOC115601966 isoform X2 n=1 Tax=Strigops habroptila TaxID=2489341 RepID=UPI0011D01267|nr:uncharacterized protein LOC115601966 isoform X2 [Strigops habroptila]